MSKILQYPLVKECWIRGDRQLELCVNPYTRKVVSCNGGEMFRFKPYDEVILILVHRGWSKWTL